VKRQMLIAVLVVGIALLAALPALADPPVHSVHVGGPDFCAAYDLQPGCDKNVAIHAVKDGNGEVTGQWDDRWAFDWGGFHATIDCLEIEGNEAWVSGVITTGIFNDGSEVFDLNGLRHLPIPHS
jgi:hypothetical protein